MEFVYLRNRVPKVDSTGFFTAVRKPGLSLFKEIFIYFLYGLFEEFLLGFTLDQIL